jgi:glycosyltransferase involved in cell wall biosynthesis
LQKAAHFLAEVSDEFLSDDVIADFYRLADALLLPSREEGFGIPIIEAAFSRLPVFCADIPVLRELADGHVSYFDPDAHPEEVVRLIKLRLEAETTSRWGRSAKQGFTWDQIYSVHIAALLKEVM